jgi:hypothetical protein
MAPPAALESQAGEGVAERYPLAGEMPAAMELPELCQFQGDDVVDG